MVMMNIHIHFFKLFDNTDISLRKKKRLYNNNRLWNKKMKIQVKREILKKKKILYLL
jgi:hypothetical protein